MNFYTNNFPLTCAWKTTEKGGTGSMLPLADPIEVGAVFKIKAIGGAGVDLQTIDGSTFATVPMDILQFGFTESSDVKS